MLTDILRNVCEGSGSLLLMHRPSTLLVSVFTSGSADSDFRSAHTTELTTVRLSSSPSHSLRRRSGSSGSESGSGSLVELYDESSQSIAPEQPADTGKYSKPPPYGMSGVLEHFAVSDAYCLTNSAHQSLRVFQMKCQQADLEVCCSGSYLKNNDNFVSIVCKCSIKTTDNCNTTKITA